MQVILIKDVEKLGLAGEVVKVKDGYGRNYLIPGKLAVGADNRNVSFLENEKKKLEVKSKKQKEEAAAFGEKLQNIACTIAMPTGEDDKLFGEITAEMIANFYKQEGLDIDKRKITLGKPIRHLGVYQAEVKLHADVVAGIKVWVVKK